MVDTGVEQGNSKEIQKGLSRNGQDGQDRTFALKLDNLFCPMTHVIT